MSALRATPVPAPGRTSAEQTPRELPRAQNWLSLGNSDGWGAPGHLVPPRKEREGGGGAGRVEDPAGHRLHARGCPLKVRLWAGISASGLLPCHLDLDLGAAGRAGRGPRLARSL